MPLAFQSINKGTIPFGFFNIETDLLILDKYFFFASDFCRKIINISDNEGQEIQSFTWKIFHIEDGADIGDFMGAMHGIRYTGFMGELYKIFPFPDREEDFKQKYKGYLKHNDVEPILSKWSIKIDIPVQVDIKNEQVRIGEYLFSGSVFRKLIYYVWQGGYPKWKDAVRPEYVEEMKTRLLPSRNPIFSDLSFDV